MKVIKLNYSGLNITKQQKPQQHSKNSSRSNNPVHLKNWCCREKADCNLKSEQVHSQYLQASKQNANQAQLIV